MKCPESSKILDLIENRLAESESQKLETHIQECAKCVDLTEWARRTLATMKNSSLVDAPEYVIQKAVSIFPKEKVKISDWIIAKLNFDSWRTPEMAGMRSEDAGPRQLIYHTYSYKIVLMNEPGRLIGQIVSDRANVETAGCLIELSAGKKTLGSTVTNQNGEFMLNTETRKNLTLKIHGQPESVLIMIQH
jgi:hypothetical protein